MELISVLPSLVLHPSLKLKGLQPHNRIVLVLISIEIYSAFHYIFELDMWCVESWYGCDLLAAMPPKVLKNNWLYRCGQKWSTGKQRIKWYVWCKNLEACMKLTQQCSLNISIMKCSITKNQINDVCVCVRALKLWGLHGIPRKYLPFPKCFEGPIPIPLVAPYRAILR